MTSLFERRDIQQYADSLARYLPGDRLFVAKNIQGSELRRFLEGMALELYRAGGALRDFSLDILPDQTVKFIDEWESAVGIPDDCFPGTGTIAERRRNVLAKLAALGVQTLADFQALADLFDITAVIYPGEQFAIPLAYPKFTIVVEWFGATPEQSAQIVIVKCLFERLKPANVELLVIPLNFFAQAGEAAMLCGEDFAQCGNSLF